MSRPFHFKQFSIFQDNAAMKVGTDGVLLGAWAQNVQCEKILDIGCGTGLISLMMAQRFPNSHIDAVDVDEKAIDDARINFSNSKWDDRIRLENSNILDLSEEKKYDLIVCNPPFFEADSRAPDTSRALARSGMDISFLEWINKMKLLLDPFGSIGIIYPITEWNRIKGDIEETGLHIHRYCEVKPTEEKKAHRVLVQLGIEKKDAIIEKVLVIEISRHKYTDEYVRLTRSFYLKMP